MLDILDFMLPDQVWALSYHLEATGEGGHPIFAKVKGNQIWYMKSKSGFPWDMNTFDSKYVYQSITETGWSNPESYKIFASKSFPNSNGGVVWSPRELDTDYVLTMSKGVVTLDSTYRNYTNCAEFTLHDLGGPILTQVEGPLEKDCGGDVGLKDVVITYYRWGKNQDNLEVNTWAKGYGWVQWELWERDGGVYVQKKVSAFNHEAPGGAPEPVFPCGVPVIKMAADEDQKQPSLADNIADKIGGKRWGKH